MERRRGVRVGQLFRPLPPSEAVRARRHDRRRMLRRALRGRCPLCGAPGLRAGWGSIRQRCPGCNFQLSREPGYLSGPMWLNLTVTLTAFALVLLLGAVLTAPATPWVLLGGATLATVLVVPVLFQPFAVALWLWVDLAYFRPLDAGDLAANDPGGEP